MDSPYIFSGKETIQVAVALCKLKNCLGIDTLLLEGAVLLTARSNGQMELMNSVLL